MTESHEQIFLKYRSSVIDLMSEYVEKMAGIVERTVGTLFEITDKMIEPFIKSEEQKRYKILADIGDIIDKTTGIVQKHIDKLLKDFSTDMMLRSSEWATFLDVTQDEMASVIRATEADIKRVGYNAIREDIPYLKKRLEAVFIDNINRPKQSSINNSLKALKMEYGT
jgi:hypothetical protein